MPRRAMVVKLQRDADHVVAGIGEQRRRDGGSRPRPTWRRRRRRVGRPALDIEPVEHGHTISAAHRRRRGCPFTCPLSPVSSSGRAKLPPARKGCRASPAAAAAQSLERTWFVARAPFGPPVARLRASDRDSAEVFCRAAYPVEVSAVLASVLAAATNAHDCCGRGRAARVGVALPPRPRHRRRPHRPRQRQTAHPRASRQAVADREAGRSQGSSRHREACDERPEHREDYKFGRKASTGAHSPAKDSASAAKAEQRPAGSRAMPPAAGRAGISHAVASRTPPVQSPTALSWSGKASATTPGCSGHRRRGGAPPRPPAELQGATDSRGRWWRRLSLTPRRRASRG